MIAVIVSAPGVDVAEVVRLAGEFSPRIECGASGVALDAGGVARLFGGGNSGGAAWSGAEGFARELAAQAAARGLAVRVAVAATRTAAALMANGDGYIFSPGGAAKNHTRPLVIPPGREAAALAPLPIACLAGIADLLGPALAKASAVAPSRRTKGQGRHYRLAPAPAPAPEITRSPDHEITKSIDRLARWGLRTLGDLALLPSKELSARMGEPGLVLQRAARGEDERPLVPAAPEVSFMQSMRLEWPVDDLQPLAFIVSGLCESLEQALARADRGAIALTTLLRLVTPGDHLTGGGSLPSALAGKVREYHALSSGLRNKAAYARTLTLPAPMRDARVLRTLVMLDLESHPPGAAIDEVVIDVDVAPGRILQTGLFEPALPAPDALSTLVARLGALVGESRVGAPALVDTHRPGAFETAAFAPHAARSAHGTRLTARDARDSTRAPSSPRPEPGAVSREPDFVPSVIRRFRPPRAARVRTGARGPVHVEADDIRGGVTIAAGPWRASGGWWAAAWDRDEWDVALDTGLTCRLAQDRATGKWVVDGVLD